MKGIIQPRTLQGTVTVPTSKSIAHRAIVCAALSKGVSEISRVPICDDIDATIGAVRTLGAQVHVKDDHLIVQGIGHQTRGKVTIDCKESGSTLRFLVPVTLAMCNDFVRFVGSAGLAARPMEPYRRIAAERGIYFHDDSRRNPARTLDLNIKGKLKGGRFELPGGVSSQFVSGLLMVMPIFKKGMIDVDGTLQSRAYVDLTLDCMRKFGVEMVNFNYKRFVYDSGHYRRCDLEIEGDYSQAAFFAVANYLGAKIEIDGLNEQSLQGDKAIYAMLDRLSARAKDETLTFDGSDCPDLIPVFCVACALSKGKTIIENIGRLRLKECDRQAAICKELSALGANIAPQGDSIVIEGVQSLRGGKVSAHGDHRIAMSLAIAATRADGDVALDDCDCVAKSYPGFWNDYRALGGSLV